MADGRGALVRRRSEPRGHAIEFRINAEDPATGFLPSPGQIVDYREPGGFGVRVDSGYEAGSTISQYYDNLVAKLVVWGRDRDRGASSRSRRALARVHDHRDRHHHPVPPAAPSTPQSFLDGTHHTRTVEDEMDLAGLQQPAAADPPRGRGDGRARR